MAQRLRKRNCRNCGYFFIPDQRNVKRQEYCRKPECRKTSKAAAQARWLAKRENKNYFRGPENVRRVQEWRKHNPGYYRRKGTGAENALQDHSNDKIVGKQYVVKQLTKDALQDDIANTTRRMQQLGADILNSSTPNFQGEDYASKNPYSPQADPPCS